MNRTTRHPRSRMERRSQLRLNEHHSPAGKRLSFEPLEDRTLLTVSVSGIPNWVEQGPAPMHNGNNVVLTNSPQVGAIEAIAADPTDADRVFVATVGGGVWRTTNATAASPNWTPLTDQMPSLEMGAIAFDPNDGTFNTVWAGTGRFSNGFGDGGPAVGLYKTTDGGANWVQLGKTELSGLNVESVVPTTLTVAGKEVVLVATNNGGVWRSIDGGDTFTSVSDGAVNHLPVGGATQLVADPGNSLRFYVGIRGQGVYKTTDGGATWSVANGSGLNAITGIAGDRRIELSVSAAAGNPVYAAIVDGNGKLSNVFRSANQGVTWNAIGTAPDVNQGGQGGINVALLADPADGNVVYVSGDRGPGNPGNLYQGDAGTNTWTIFVGAGANGTRPHPDSRDLVFDAGGNILQSNDGGIYRLTNVSNAATRTWVDMNGNLGITEFYSIAYDPLNNVLFGGAQDNGSPEQSAQNNLLWNDQVGGDGTNVAYTPGPDATHVYHYSSSQNLGTFRRQLFDNTNSPSNSTVGLVVNGTGGQTLSQVETNVTSAEAEASHGAETDEVLADTTIQFVQPYALNRVDPTRMLIGTNYLYESFDRGDTLTSVGGVSMVSPGNYKPINGIGTVDPAAFGTQVFNPIVYGGMSGGSPNADLIWIGAGGQLLLRTSGTGLPTPVAAYPGGTVLHISVDPEDWHTAIVVNVNGQVWETPDAGATWSNLTGNLDALAGADVRTVEFVKVGGNVVLVAGAQGGLYRSINPTAGNAQWELYGAALPHVLVTSVVYDSTDDLLAVGTWGRGAWDIPSASATLAVPGVLQIDGDMDFAGEDDTFRLVRNANNPLLLDVFVNNVLAGEYQLATLQQINVNGLGGNDTLIVDSSNGLITVPNGIRFDGGTGVDNLQLAQDGGDIQASDVYSVGPNNGEGNDVITGPSGVQTVYFQNLAPVVDLVPAATAIVNATAADNAINYAQGAIIANGLVTIDNQESYEFSNKDNLVLNGRAGSDTINLNNSNVPVGATPGGLKSITVNGSDPTSPPGDTLIVNAITGATDELFVQPTGQGAGIVTESIAGRPNVTFTGAEGLHLVGQTGENDTFGVDGTAGDDSFAYAVGASADSGAVTGLLNQNGGGAFPLVPIAFSGMSPAATREFNTLTTGGVDAFTFAGTSGDDAILIGNAVGGAIAIQDSLGGVNYGSATLSNFAAATADGGTGNDAFTYDASSIAGSSPPTITIKGGGSPGDALTYKAPSGALTSVNFNLSRITSAGAKDLFFSGLSLVVDQASGAGAALTVNGIAGKKTMYTPSGVSSGSIQSAGNPATLDFTGVTGQLTLFGGGGTADELAINGTSGRDAINVLEATGAVTVTTNGTTYKPAILGTDVQILTVNGVGGQDTFEITPAAGIQFAPDNIDNLIVNVNGSSTGANNSLVLQAAGGGVLPADEFVVVNRGATAGTGTVRTFKSAVQWPDINYKNIQVVSPNVALPAGKPNLLVMGPDVNEPNEFRDTATFLGAGATLQVQHASIFANNAEFPATPADQDYYRVVAQQTGTLDFDVSFNLFDPGLLPAGGNLNLDVLDEVGNVLARASGGAAMYGAEGAGGDARIRIPVVAGQTYLLHVFGANPDGTANPAAVNGYDVTIINTPPPAPTLVELSRSVPPPIAGNPGTGDLPPGAAADDTGRSQLDDVTKINTPTIYVRLTDAIFLNDLPGNGLPDSPFAGVIPIPFSPDAMTSGFRLAIFLGDDTANPVGFATPVAGFPGLYQYTFTTPLADGINHITARVQMIDPTEGKESGFGGASTSLDITVDTAPPPVFFGSPPAANTGLDGPSDTGVPSQSATLADRITSDATPTFYGLAEADSIVRAYVDANQNNVFDAGDILIGKTTATPLDGANAFANGQWRLTSNIDLNNPLLGLPLDGVRNIFVTAEDLAGNVSGPQELTIFLDTQGPVVNNVTVTASPGFDLFAVKANVTAPTPLVNSLDITFHDQPVRVGPDFVYPAVNQILATTKGNYSLVGDATGPVAIDSITFADSTVAGVPGTSVVTLHFAAPLADDRYTLVINDHITDNAGNALDGNFGGSFDSGDGKPGGSFSGRFTVDSRPELGVYSAGSAAIDLNGNFTFDPQNPDAVNRDTVFTLGYPSDRLFAGKFPDSHGVVNGFDKLGAYGFVNGQWRWLLDLNGDGAVETSQGDVNVVEPLNIDGLPVAGAFDGNPAHGEQIGLFDGSTWWFDLNGDHVIDGADVALGGALTGDMRGLPITGDFDGDGKTDLGTYSNGTFYFDLAALDPGGHLTGNTNKTINVQPLLPNSIGFADVQLRPFATDIDQDGITDIGLFVPGGTAATPSGTAQWYALISNDPTGAKRSPGSVATLAHAFDPTPLGHDLVAVFGNEFALPIVGNFDPPANAQEVVGGWVNNLYQDVLGRAPSYDEWHAWSQAVDNGAVKPKTVPQLFLASPERRGGIIGDLYQQYLGRLVDAAGLNYWLAIWQATGGPEQVQAGIIGSSEYYHTAGQLHPDLSPDEAWVTALYENILNREVDAAGLAFWVNYIQTHSKRSVVIGFVTSDEYRLGLIQGWFSSYLGRELDATGADYWLRQMQLGATQESIQAGILSSDEYRNKS